jgi:hypothetical protein
MLDNARSVSDEPDTLRVQDQQGIAMECMRVQKLDVDD